ncbi:MAG TPA: quinone oxidoreductase [Bacillales bacterium]|nr:quinone oxidoreductase [Bacillales bacterium]
MKAVVVSSYGGPEVLNYEEVAMPTPKADQVLIRVGGAAVNFADLKARYGNYHRGKQPPYIPGVDVAGTVEAVGSKVTAFREGQRVIAFPTTTGSYAEFTVANENLTFALPDGVPFDAAAACPIVAFTSYHLLSQVGRVQPGESVLIHAASGGVGTTAIQIAKILGARLVIGTVGSEEKKETAKLAGADIVINYREEDFVERVREVTNGTGADVILDSVAGDTGEKSLHCLAMYGRLVNFGNASGKPAQYQTDDLYPTCRAILGFSLGTTRKQRPELLRPTAEKVLTWIKDGRLKMMIGRKYALSDAKAAHKWMESRKNTGKVILVP